MRHNFFGEPQPEPQDDLQAAFDDYHGNCADLECESHAITHEEHLGGWTATVANGDGNELTTVAHPDRESVMEYLTRYEVEVV